MKSGSSSDQGAKASLSGGNGSGYDGKPYVQGSCKKALLSADEKSVAVVRDNCQNLASPRITQVTADIYRSDEPEILRLEGSVLVSETLPREYIASCRETMAGGTEVSVLLWRDPQGALFGSGIETATNSILRTGDLALDERRVNSQIDFTSRAMFNNRQLLDGSISLTSKTANFSYVIPPRPSWNLEVNVPCVVN